MIVALVLAALIATNAVFVAAELALVAVPRAVVERLAAGGDRRAAVVLRILRDPVRQDRYVATAQLAITAASVALGMYGELQLAALFEAALRSVELPSGLAAHGLASVVSIGLLTYLHIVLGEMIPKALALSHTESVVLAVTPLVRVAEGLLYPVISVLSRLGNGVIALFGVSLRAGPERGCSREELHVIVSESADRGVISGESAGAIQRLIRFSKLTAREVMVPRVKTIAVKHDASLEELRRVLLERPHTRYPVYGQGLDDLVGLVHTRELLRCLRERRRLGRTHVEPVPFVPESASLTDVLAIMRSHAAHLLVVMDEHGGTAGILTTRDLFRELVEEVPGAPPPRRDQGRVPPTVPATVLEVPGTHRLAELGRQLSRELTHPEVDSVSGLVLAELRRPPRIGDRVSFGGLSLEVLAVEGHGVARCRVTVAGPAAPAPSGGSLPARPA